MNNGVTACLVLNVFTFCSVCARLVCCYCALSTQVLKNIVLQSGVATRFRCGEICHKSILQMFAGSDSDRIFGADVNKSLSLIFWPILCDSIILCLQTSEVLLYLKLKII